MPEVVENGKHREREYRHRGRTAQIPIYLGKQFRFFINQSDWKVLPMAAVIAALVSMVIREHFFVNMEGSLIGAFSLACVAIWNGCFNSIQAVCRERPIIKREHRSGMHVSSYVAAHMIYQLLLCLAQTAVTLVTCKLAGVTFPAQGIVTPWGIADLGITILLITYASDMLALMISSLVRTTTTAMTVMPFLLIFQLVFSGSFFDLSGFAKKLTTLTMSRWGMTGLCAIGGYNNLPMVTLWNTMYQFRDVDMYGQKPILEFIRKTQEEGRVGEFLLWSGQHNQNEAFVSAASNVLHAWGVLLLLVAVFAIASVIALKFVDRDKR